jgi:hypothetical protein
MPGGDRQLVSLVSDEAVPMSTPQDAVDVLEANASVMEEAFDRQLLGALLNFANGAVEWDQLIDTDGDLIGDTAFSDVIAAAEAVRLNSASTRHELEAQKNLLELINLGLARSARSEACRRTRREAGYDRDHTNAMPLGTADVERQPRHRRCGCTAGCDRPMGGLASPG